MFWSELSEATVPTSWLPVGSVIQPIFGLVQAQVVQLFASTYLTKSMLLFISIIAFLLCDVISWVLFRPQLSVSAIRWSFPFRVRGANWGFKFCDSFLVSPSSCGQFPLLFTCAVLEFPAGSFIIRIVGVFPFLPSLPMLLRAYVILLGDCSTTTPVNLFWFCTPRAGAVGFHIE